MQLFFKEHFQLIAFQKLKDWRLEKFCMKNHTCLLDHNQKEWSIGFYSWTTTSWKTRSTVFLDVSRVKFSKPTQSKPQSNLWNLRTQNVFLWRKEKRPVHKRSMINVCTKNLDFRSEKPEKLSEDIRVKHAHDGKGQVVESSSSSTHTVKEQFVPEEHRDIASFNEDNEFNRAIDEENIDFNIPGMPNSTLKRSHDVNVKSTSPTTENGYENCI